MREDLTPEIRFSIAIQAFYAQINQKYGNITALAKEYKVCRQFVYNLLYTLKCIEPLLFAPQKKIASLSKKAIISTMLSFRMEGGSSLQAVSTMMRGIGSEKYSSVGYISETLSRIGGLLPNTLQMTETTRLVIASDEIFSKSQPILIDVEPGSSAIIKIELSADRTGETWSEHYNEILDNGFDINGVVSDGGTGLLSGLKKSHIKASWQPDTYHAIAHHLGVFVSKFKSKAYNAIQNEYDKEALALRSKTDETFEKRYKLYLEDSISTIESIELYENFTFLYRSIITELRVFKRNGELSNRVEAEGNIKAGLILLEGLKHEEISKEIKSVKKILPQLLDYFEQAKESVTMCKRFDINDKALTTLCLLWQGEKSLIKAKNKYRRKNAREQKNRIIKEAKYLLGKEFGRMKDKVFGELDKIIQASSIVETINSILRPYLDRSKNQVTQEFLNLFAFYHNHRVYNDGKRKGKIPMEILTNQKQDKSWIELLMDTVEEKEPSFFL
jgi:F0F1-type ATP synthase membrane subunit b/b'